MDTGKFTAHIEEGFNFKTESLVLGAAMLDNKTVQGLQVKIPLKTLNRHGLIAGATGTGKTKTIQGMAEQLSAKGIPTLMMDIKGDLSGLAAEGITDAKITDRHSQIGEPWTAAKFPVELMTISNEKGIRLRATVSEFGPVLFSKILGLNDTQGGVVALVFKYSDDNKLPLLDLKDFKKTIQFLTNEGKIEIEKEYGRISTASTSTIIRKIIELEQQGAEMFFGEKSFDTDDLLRVDDNSYGYMNLIRLRDIQDRPKLFSTFMLCLLAEIYAQFPEEGDLEMPKLVIFIDEAHLIFKEASKALLEQLETIIKLIRSKGVGVFFCTQSPVDIPKSVLAQLGLKIQHALRAFTVQDRKDIKMVADNYPESEFYKTEDLLTQLGIGESVITALNEKGVPTPLVCTLLRAPQSRMDILNPGEIDILIGKSELAVKYNKSLDRESAYEMLNAKLKQVNADESENKKSNKKEPGSFEKAVDSTAGRQVMRTVARELTRGLLGVLGVRAPVRRRRRTGWF